MTIPLSATLPSSRRAFFGALAALVSARALLAAAGARLRIGICSFSCHQHWKAVGAGNASVKFRDTPGFYGYARGLGAEGVQTALRSRDTDFARRFRRRVEDEGGYFEGELTLPKTQADVAEFETDVRTLREAGASVARAVFTGGRRYETFASMEDFRAFARRAEDSLRLAEPIVRRHALRLAIENHKDFTTDELVAVMRRVSSEWVGVLVDTGNNIALLEEPHAVVDALAPYAFSVHFKDMAVRPCDDGFLLSEVPLGSGALDLPRIIRTLARSRPGLVLNLEMATRDPLRVSCRSDRYFVTFPERRETHLEKALRWVSDHPPSGDAPSVVGKASAEILADEEKYNRVCLDWMKTRTSV